MTTSILTHRIRGIAKLSQEQFFMLAMLIVNGGNYLYNLFLGRILGPADFSDAALLITLLMVLSFVGMTFQLVAAKYVVLFSGDKRILFVRQLIKYALIVGTCVSVAVGLTQNELQTILSTQSNMMFGIFALGLPIYFLMSVNRGVYQGENQLISLSYTYLLEMGSRLFLTLGLLYFIPNYSPSILVASGILLSFIWGVFPIKRILHIFKTKAQKVTIDYKPIRSFIIIMAAYECTQIVINNSDIILVKSFFDPEQAGLYASLALIGRVVYFVAWLFVMMLLPKVIALHKEGKRTDNLLLKNLLAVMALAISIVVATFLFPETIVQLLFGKAYHSIAPLLWKYAFATSVFAMANIFTYYYLSISKYWPVAMAGLAGVGQVLGVFFWHKNLTQVVEVQIVVMVLLLITQLIYFFYQQQKESRRN